MKISKNKDKNNQVQLQIEKSFSGPLPSPETLYQYNQIVPNAAERILAMAEKEIEHRHKIDKKTILLIFLGQIFSILLIIICLTIAFIFAIYGYSSISKIIVYLVFGTAISLFANKIIHNLTNKINEKNQK